MFGKVDADPPARDEVGVAAGGHSRARLPGEGEQAAHPFSVADSAPIKRLRRRRRRRRGRRFPHSTLQFEKQNCKFPHLNIATEDCHQRHGAECQCRKRTSHLGNVDISRPFVDVAMAVEREIRTLNTRTPLHCSESWREGAREQGGRDHGAGQGGDERASSPHPSFDPDTN